MEKVFLKVDKRIIDMTLAYDVYNDAGSMIIPANTLITDYFYNKLQEFKIDRVFVYKTPTVHGDEYLKLNGDQKNYIQDVNTAKTMLQDLASGKNLDMEKAESISDHIYSKINDIGSLFECINSVKVADEYTYSHSINVSAYCMLLGKWMNLDEKQLQEVVMAGLLHDIGKAQVPSSILNKKGPLTTEEFEVIKLHPVYGYESIKSNSDINIEIKKAILMHHEKENGKGYPFGISGKQKNLYSKIVTVADIFDAITSERLYKKKQTPFMAFKELEKAGYDTIDPEVMMVMFTNMPNYYIGSKVKMASGEIGEIVYVPSQCIYEPVVKVKDSFLDFAKDKESYIKEFL